MTYESGGVRSTIDYLMMRKRDRVMVKNVKVINGEEVVSQHSLLVGDLTIRSTKKSKRKFVPKLKVWRLKEETVGIRFAELVEAGASNVSDAVGVNNKWVGMKNVCLSAAAEVCGWTKGPPRHRETWWWNADVAEVVDEKKRCYKKWQKSKAESDKAIYVEAKRKAQKAVANAQERKRQEFASDLASEAGKRNVFRIAKQMAKERQDVVGVNCLKDADGNIVIDSNEIKDDWRQYMEKLLNEENEWDNDIECDVVEGPRCWIKKEEVKKALDSMKKGKVAGQTRVVTEMLNAMKDFGVEWLTDLCNAM